MLVIFLYMMHGKNALRHHLARMAVAQPVERFQTTVVDSKGGTQRSLKVGGLLIQSALLVPIAVLAFSIT